MRRAPWVGLLLLFACGRPGLRSVVGEVEVSPGALHFGRTWVGYPTQATLVLHNSGRVDQRLTLSAAPPFFGPDEQRVPGGAQLAVQVTFAPTAAGPATGTLRVSDGQQLFDVALDGEALAPPSCSAASLCRVSVFSPTTGACVETDIADGTACSSVLACAVEGVCSRGACLGASPDCSDQNPCTLDACQPGGGCQHQPKTCAAPNNPCKVASCDPTQGCVESDAQDGTSCGAADCSTAHVCINGACKELPVPEGASCGVASPCQERGVCRQSRCDLPAQGKLKEAWSRRFPATFDFRGVSDAAQNLYWLECGSESGFQCGSCTRCSAVSVTRDGVENYRQDLGPMPLQTSTLTHLLTQGRLVYVANSEVGALSALTGAPSWSRPLSAVLQAAPDTANSEFVQSIAADGKGSVYLMVRRYENAPNSSFPRHHALVKLDSASGAVVLARFFDGELSGLVVDESDDVYFGLYPRAVGGVSPPPEVRSISASGADRWRTVEVGSSPVTPLSVFNRQLVLVGGRVVSTSDGAKLLAAPSVGVYRNPLMSLTERTVLLQPTVTKPSPLPSWTVTAISVPSTSETPSWAMDVASTNHQGWHGVSDLVAGANGDTLVAGASGTNTTALTALTATGAPRFTCELPTMGSGLVLKFDSPVVLLEGRWALVDGSDCCDFGEERRLRLFEVPGQRPARRGWVGAAGGPSGGARPLP